MKKLSTRSIAIAVVTLAALLAAGQGLAQTPTCKIGFVNLAKVLDQSKEGQRLKEKLDAERDRALAPLKTKQKELERLQNKMTELQQEVVNKSMVWSDDEKLLKQNEMQSLQLQYQQLGNSLMLEERKIAKDLNAKKTELLKPLEDKLNAIMEEIGKTGGYCVVFDVSPPMAAPNMNPIIYRDPALDITDEVIKAVDK